MSCLWQFKKDGFFRGRRQVGAIRRYREMLIQVSKGSCYTHPNISLSEITMKKLIHFIRLLFCILVLMGSGLMGFAYAEGNAVEPISNGLSLRWGNNEVRQEFGEPQASSISCEMNYGAFKFEKCYGPSSSRLYIYGPDVKLSSGIGVGSSKAEVASVFGNSYGSKLGPYALDFKYSGDRVSRISIDYDARADGGQTPITPQPSNSSGIAGMYWCIAPTFSVGGTLNLLPNGTYEMNGAGVAGRPQAGRGQRRSFFSLKHSKY